ncbi:amino acid-binding protein [Natrarchaeobius chitinivorans]|uniref:Amino acid-binding protein n=1 Tax=Natrarchaeobius chitinivorans TaxID=1679083 RepID=A0A3N6MHY9_NATCH|nr:amino acid-binding protein [Natrarchaeobius chitinivorans]
MHKSAHTIRLELVDEPGSLLEALKPIVANEGNLLSIYHERGKKSPRGRVPVEVDFEATDRQYNSIIMAFRRSGFTVVETGKSQYSEEFIVLLAGDVIETDVTDTIERVRDGSNVSVIDVSLTPGQSEDEISGARFRLATQEGKMSETLEMLREITEEKGLKLIEPLTEVER